MISPAERRILQQVDQKDLVELTRDLVRIDSVIRPETGNTEARAVHFLAAWVERELGVKPSIEEVELGRENLVATLDSGRPGPCLMFEGHTDVVTEGERGRWTVDPFGGEVREGRLYGRGSCDMKAGLAVNLIAVRALLRSGVPWKGRIRLGFVCDEEGMMIGVKDFIRRGHADDVDACLVSEPEENQLCLSMKGAMRAVVRVTGKMAHGAMPLTGINPNPRLARIVLAYEEYETQEKARCGKDEYLGWPSITFTVLQAPPGLAPIGSIPPGAPVPPAVVPPPQLNVMPGEAVGYLDIRTIPAQKHEVVRARLEAILKELAARDPELRASIEFIEDRPVVSIGRDEPIVRAADGAYRDLTGKEPRYNGVPGATDGTFLSSKKRIPCLVNGPGPRHIPHQADEYVELDELEEAARLYAVTAYRFLEGGKG